MKDRNKNAWSDPIIKEIHEIREQYAREFDYSIDAIVEDLKRRQKESDREVVSFPPRRIDQNGKRGAA